MTDSSRNPDAPVPTRPVPALGSSESKTSAVRSEAAMHTPQVTRSDLETLVRKIHYDVDSARVKLIELRAHIAALDLPSVEEPFSEEKALAFVRNTAHEYTDSSLADELALRGADRGFIDRALMVAADVRRQNGEPVKSQ